MGILFSHHTHCYSLTQNNQGVSSPCMGILFSHSLLKTAMMRAVTFRPHVWGFFFHTAGLGYPTGWALYGPFAAGISN